MDTTSTLKLVGFTPKQAAVYQLLLQRGEGSMTEVARETRLKRSTTYLVVEELQVMGFVSETLRGKRKVYSAAHPRRLADMVKFKERHIDETLPELVALYNTTKEKPKIQVFEGYEGVRLLYKELNQSLSNREEALWFSRVGAVREVMPEALIDFKKMLRQLRHPRIRELNYDDEEGRRWAEETKRLRGKHHFVRILPTDFEFGFSDHIIFQNKLVMFSLKQRIFVVVIESEELVKTYRALFECAWKQGKEV